MSEARDTGSLPAPHREGTGPGAPRLVPALVLGAVMLGAALLLLLGLGETGLWTRGELPILDRTLAALGEPRSQLERSPWLPDQLRTWAYVASGRSDFGLRLPGALAGLGLVGLTLTSARRLGWSPAWIALAGCFALAMPLLLSSSRTALGNPTGELWLSAGVLALAQAVDPREPSRGGRVGLGLIGLACLGAAVASLGIVLGGCLPLTLVALIDVAHPKAPRGPTPPGRERSIPRAWLIAAWAGAAATGLVGLKLAHAQGEGYIPLLGAAKDLALLEDPTLQGFTDTLEAFGYQVFPFTGLVVIGLLGPGLARWPALWLAVGLVFTSLWSLVYGLTPAPVTIPAALLATTACQKLFDAHEPIAARRMILVFAILGALVLGKDAGRTPQLIASPLLKIPELEFPKPGVVLGFEPSVALPRMAKRFAALLLVAHMLARPSRDQLRWRARRESPWWLRQWTTIAPIFDRLLTGAREQSGLRRLRKLAPILVLFGALASQAWAYGRTMLDEVNRQMSIAGPLQRFASAVEAGAIPDPRLGLHRIRDPGLRYYGPAVEQQAFLSSRAELDAWLAADEPRSALIRRSDLPPSFTAARTQKRPFYVLDAAHHEYLRVANFLPEGSVDQNPLLGIVFNEPPQLANQTLVAWDPYVELIAWEIEGPLHRGSEATLHLVFRVQRALPSGTQLYARLQRGKSSRVAAEPHDLTGGALPPNYWRPGDYVHHRQPLEVPWLEVLPGEHELIVGLRRSEKTNLKIARPEGEAGEYGVVLRGKSREFAVIGAAELAW
ncbi:MAG: hypothetical protein R6X02_17695 [Enhygromyxa sp.]